MAPNQSLTVNDVIVSRAVQNAYFGAAVLGKVVFRGLLLVAPVKVNDASRHLGCIGQSYHMDVVALFIHGLHLLHDSNTIIKCPT